MSVLGVIDPPECDEHGVPLDWERCRQCDGRGVVVVSHHPIPHHHPPGNAPWIDGCGGRLEDGRSWGGYAILLAPWRRDRYGERTAQTALCVGWIGAGCPWPLRRARRKLGYRLYARRR